MKKIERKIKIRKKKLRKFWKEYYVARNNLFEYYWKWARGMARIFAANYKVRFSEIETDAALGLLKAIEADRIHTVKEDKEFKRYAVIAIRTSIIDGIKDMKGIKGRKGPKIGDIASLAHKVVNFRRIKKIRDEVRAIEEYVNELDPFEKNLIYRRFFLGEKLKDISQDLGLSQPVLSNKCREIVKEMIENIGAEPVA